MEGSRPGRLSVGSWILYDLANTIFSFVVLSFYFGPWLVEDVGARDSWVTVTESLSMALVLLLAPLLGALADRTRKVPFLVATTLAAVGATALLGVGEALGWSSERVRFAAVAFFFLANVGFQLGLVAYDALLPAVSTRATVGRVGSLGVAVGYFGSVVGLVLGTLVLGANEAGEPLLFLLTALAFLAFALPAFFLIREPRGPGATGSAGLLREAFGGVVATLRRLPRERPLARFLVGRWLYADAANTVILVLGIFAVKEAGFRTADLSYTVLLGLGIVAAIVAAPLWGLLADRIGPKNALMSVLVLWIVTLLVTALHPVLALPRPLFYVYGALIGVCLGGTWSCDRPILVGLAPAGRVGEWFGLYAMAGRFAAITGPLLYSGIVDGLLRDARFARPAGLAALALMVAASFLVLRKLEDPFRPGLRPYAGLIPWRDGAGRPWPRGRAWSTAAPFLLLYVLLSWALFLPVAVPVSGENGFYSLPPGTRERWTYAIPDLTADPAKVALNFVTAPILNHDLIQLLYVTVLLLAFGLAFEAKEGWRRTALVFVGSGFLGGLLAGVALHLLYPAVSAHPILEAAWTRTWSGGSAGAFGLMGAFAARARAWWFWLAVFAVWEVNVGYWFLRSYTPAFHVTALLVGFATTRFLLRPRRAPAAAEA